MKENEDIRKRTRDDERGMGISGEQRRYLGVANSNAPLPMLSNTIKGTTPGWQQPTGIIRIYEIVSLMAHTLKKKIPYCNLRDLVRWITHLSYWIL